MTQLNRRGVIFGRHSRGKVVTQLARPGDIAGYIW